ncbi:MAG: L-threonylcarbamoyladenylate synthase, partial [Pseudomonadota bacterium]|nr:L-threonylcarbamoyladenylate synthase [Pseudomonadota bacterium]
MSPLETEHLAPDHAGVARAAALLNAGGLIAMPTETVYGLAADARNDLAVARIFEAKGRPRFNPLIVHVADAEAAKRYVIWSDLADQLAQAFWPGALTLVLPLREDSAATSERTFASRACDRGPPKLQTRESTAIQREVVRRDRDRIT